MVDPQDLAQISEGAKLAGVLPHIRAEIEKMEATLEARMFQAIREGTLTPDVAHAAWLEKYAYRRLLTRFEQKVRLGVSLGSRTDLDMV